VGKFTLPKCCRTPRVSSFFSLLVGPGGGKQNGVDICLIRWDPWIKMNVTMYFTWNHVKETCIYHTEIKQTLMQAMDSEMLVFTCGKYKCLFLKVGVLFAMLKLQGLRVENYSCSNTLMPSCFNMKYIGKLSISQSTM